MDRLQEIKDKYMYWEYDFNLNKEDINFLIEQSERYEKTMLKIKEVYESDDENKLDEFLHGLFTNEVYNDSY